MPSRTVPMYLFLALLVPVPDAWADTPSGCLSASGNTAYVCLRQYTNHVERCLAVSDPTCEAGVRQAGGPLETAVAAIAARVGRACSDETADALDFFGLDDVVLRAENACRDYGEDFLAGAIAPDPETLGSDALRCQRRVVRSLERVRNRIVSEHGRRCFVSGFRGRPCDRARRDARLARVLDSQRASLLRTCGAHFDALGLSTLDPGTTTLEARIADVIDRTASRARHFAQQVFPPNDLGPAAAFGAHPVGVTTLALVDASRTHVSGAGPRPVTTEVFYPSTEAATAGVPNDVVAILGIDVAETPAFRDVDLAAGRYPLIVFSHGNGGIRLQSFFFAAHLASHGFVVATPDHHGNTFTDELLGIVDGSPSVNRPLDMSFLIDAMLALDTTPGDRFEGAVDGTRIGASGHSFGGYTTFALAGGAFGLGTFTDPRVGAIFPQAPATGAFPDAFFGTIPVPTLIVGGTLDETTPFAGQQRAFDNLAPGAAVVALGELVDAGHITFSDFCEVPRSLLAFLGGFSEACEPRHLPWRHAHDIINLLGLSFFDGVLNGNAAALARLDPASLAGIEDLVYQSK